MIRVAAVAIWGTAVARELESPLPDCTKCRMTDFTELRVQWGCDRPADKPIFRISCYCVDPQKCERCKGTGEIDMYRCPRSILEQADPSVGEFVEAYHHFTEHHIAPEPGGWMDQTSHFSQAVSILGAERGKWEKMLSDHHRAQTKKVTAKAGMKHGR